MKISKIILLATAAVILAIFIVFALMLHNTVQFRRAAEDANVTYKTMTVAEFSKVELSGRVNARIRQGKVCAVEYTVASDSLKPVINNINGTLQFSIDTTVLSSALPMVKITMPRVFEITANKGSEIRMGFFVTDSVRIILGEGTAFNGSDNTFKKVTFITSGDAKINISTTF